LSVLRRWADRIRTADKDRYVDYVRRTGAAGYRATPGNLGFQILVRDLGDGTSEVVTQSWWASMEAVRAFAGPEPERARYYPEDDAFLLDKPEFVQHYEVVEGPPGPPVPG
jgi:heme-degrading monooxygenase HmoA